MTFRGSVENQTNDGNGDVYDGYRRSHLLISFLLDMPHVQWLFSYIHSSHMFLFITYVYNNVGKITT